MSSLAILIPNYNGEKFIVKTINSFLNGFPEITILVVDDGSTDSSLAILSTTSAEIIVRNKNGGFAAAVNTGLRYLLDSGFTHILVANSDVIVDRVDCLNIWSQFLSISKVNNIGVLGFVEAGQRRIPQGIEVSGFIFILSAEVVKSVGYFDESFYMYGEEQDYFLRVMASNFSIEQSGIAISHLAEGSSNSKLKNSWYAIRNSLYLQAKHARFLGFLCIAISLFLTINRIKLGVDKSDPSYRRVTRPGIILGNLFLLIALMNGLYKIILRGFYGR